MLVTAFSVNAQQKTEAELKAECEQIASELKSKDVVKRQKELVKLQENSVPIETRFEYYKDTLEGENLFDKTKRVNDVLKSGIKSRRRTSNFRRIQKEYV